MRAVGICGSDVHFWQHGGVFPFVVTDETCGGHEGAGEIIELGEGVEGFKVGDRVAVECSVPCGKCELCLEGHYQVSLRCPFAARD
jgi:L-iditol 2-dehydrogenase